MATTHKSKLGRVIDLANQCVKCGLCLPHCPTYTLTQDENESPRGRIALFQALSQHQLSHTTRVKKHLDQCLGCRACEAVCPAQVQYGTLLTLGRAIQNTQPVGSASWVITLLHTIVRFPWLGRFFHQLLWVMQITGVRQLARKRLLAFSPMLRRLETLLPTVKAPRTYQASFSGIGPSRGAVMLFLGCTHWCDSETVESAIFVLQQLGYDVTIPPSQGCCGAISAHAGKISEAQALMERNQRAFTSSPLPIITLATGCGSFLQEKAPQDDAVRYTDIMDFLSREWHSLPLAPLPLHIALHTPCTRRNVLKTPENPLALLSTIPELHIYNLRTTACCGAAGTYMLEHPTFAVPLARAILSELDNIDNFPVDYIVTSNIGCALHLQQQLRDLTTSIPLVHPVVLLARALGLK